MARLRRIEVFAPDEIAVVHTISRVVRRCYLMGNDPVTGKNYDHRKCWIENELQRMAACFGVDLIAFAILDNHFHLVLRSRPDVVETWDDTEVAKRWLTLCPSRKAATRKNAATTDSTTSETVPKKPAASSAVSAEAGSTDCRSRSNGPSEAEVKSILSDPAKVIELRSRLSDISWWMRLICQRIAQRANAEEEESGKFWRSRFRSIRLIDEEAVLAAAAYVDLNPIRATMAETIEDSEYTSAQRRVQALVCDADAHEDTSTDRDTPVDAQAAVQSEERARTQAEKQTVAAEEALSAQSLDGQTEPGEADAAASETGAAASVDQLTPQPSPLRRSGRLRPDRFLVPVTIDELRDALQPLVSKTECRCSDKGFVSMSSAEYLELLDWTARQIVAGKRGSTPIDAPPIFERLSIRPETWFELITRFDELFSVIAGQPQHVDDYRTKVRTQRHYLPKETRELLSA